MTKEQEEADFYRRKEGARAGERVTPARSARMVGHVPVRFQQSMIDRIKALSAEEGVTVSTWIRRAVDEAVRARAVTQTRPSVETVTFVDSLGTGNETVSPRIETPHSDQDDDILAV